MPYKPYRNEATRSSILAGVADSANQAAWARFFDTYAGYIFGIARSRGLAAPDADEIVQIVMRDLVHGSALRTYDKTRGPFHAWLARLVLWRTANYRQRGQPARVRSVGALSDFPAIPDPATPALPPEFEEEWMAAVTDEALCRLRAEANPAHYAVYHASAIEKLDAAAIARLYSVSPANLYQIRRRLGTRFRALLEQTMRDLDSSPPVPPERS